MKIFDQLKFNTLIKLFRTQQGSGNAQRRAMPAISMPGINFNVFRANGGLVVEVYPINRDNSCNPTLYIITEDQDFGTEISKIYTIEQLTRGT